MLHCGECTFFKDFRIPPECGDGTCIHPEKQDSSENPLLAFGGLTSFPRPTCKFEEEGRSTTASRGSRRQD